MNEKLSIDQKIEILKLTHDSGLRNRSEQFIGMVTLITEDRCLKCKTAMKDAFLQAIELPGEIKKQTNSQTRSLQESG